LFVNLESQQKYAMYNYTSSDFQNLPIYKKAVEILVLSRSISQYVQDDLSTLKIDGKEDSNIYFSGDIIHQSESLAPQIAKAQLERYSDNKYKHIASVRRLTNRLYKNCRRLENCNSNGKEYVSILRLELKKFKQLQYVWSLTL